MNPGPLVLQERNESAQPIANEPAVAVDDPRVIRAVEEYLASLETGPAPDRQEFLARYPEIAAALAKCLHGLEFVHGIAPQLNEAGPKQLPSFASEIQPEGPLGDFRIVREVGRGGMGVVYEAVQISLGRRVALKVLPFAAALDPKHLQRFKNEAQAVAQLHHTNIVPVFGVGCERGVHYYGMQFIEGQTLAKVISDLRLQIADLPKRASCRDEPPSQPATADYRLPPPDAQSAICNLKSAIPPTRPIAGLSTEHSIKSATYFRTVANLGVQVAEALEHAHDQGVIHRDIKPANLLVDGRGNLWITDFGLAHCHSQAGLTMSGDLVGTLRYMSPEQALAKRLLIDHRTDIYSLGVTLYELLTLEPAFSGRDREEMLQQIAFQEPHAPRQRNKAIPRELETIVLKSMEKYPEGRYATAKELADDLRRFLEDKPIRARRATLLQRAAKWSRRHKSAMIAAAVVLILAVVGLAAGTWLIWLQKKQTEAALADARANAERAQQNLDTAKAAKLDAEANLDIAYAVLEKIYLNMAEKRLPQRQRLTPEDREFLQNALAFYEQLARKKSTEPRVRRQTALAHLRVANTQALLGQHDEAQANYGQARVLFEGLAAEFPNDADYRQKLARCLSDMAFPQPALLHFITRQGNEETLRQAIHIQEKLVKEFPTQADYQRDLGYSYANLGWFLDDTRQFEEAQKVLRVALGIREKLAEEHPTVPSNQEELTECLNRLRTVFCQIGKVQEEEKIARQQLDLRKKLANDFPNRPNCRFQLGLAYDCLGSVLRKTKRLQEAEEYLRHSVAVHAKLVGDFPGVPFHRCYLGLTQLWLAALLQEQGRLQEAESLSQEVWAMLRRLARDYPAQVQHDWERRLRFADGSIAANLRLLRAFALVQLKQCEQAAAEAKPVIDTGDASATIVYHAACLFAQAAAAAGEDAKPTKAYASRALQLLRRAFAKGYSNVEQMQKESDLDPLRPREDFRRLLAEFGNQHATP
jgi:serine/threonine protein kinase/uncharacterized membrane protein